MVEYLASRVPAARVVWDATGNALETFVEACRWADEGPALHMEEDVILTKGFVAKANAAIGARPGQAIQFFSMRAADLAVGSREEPGRTFLMGQCFYLPAGISAAMAKYAGGWPGREKHPTGLDTMVADYLKAFGLRYWIHVPSLVQHRAGKSAIDPRRSSSRQSKTFHDPDE